MIWFGGNSIPLFLKEILGKPTICFKVLFWVIFLSSLPPCLNDTCCFKIDICLSLIRKLNFIFFKFFCVSNTTLDIKWRSRKEEDHCSLLMIWASDFKIGRDRGVSGKEWPDTDNVDKIVDIQAN